MENEDIKVSISVRKQRVDRVRVESKRQQFTVQELQESLMYYSGDSTHSCVYIFNPRSNFTEETSHTLVSVTTLKTRYYEQVSLNYEKKVYESNPNLKTRFAKVFTVYKDGNEKQKYLNITYVIQNNENKEYFINFKRPEQQSQLFTDDSAFNIERVYNASWAIGKNTYPYVNGFIWDNE